MNTSTLSRTAALAASILVTFGLVTLISGYALPDSEPALLAQAQPAASAPLVAR